MPTILARPRGARDCSSSPGETRRQELAGHGDPELLDSEDLNEGQLREKAKLAFEKLLAGLFQKFRVLDDPSGDASE